MANFQNQKELEIFRLDSIPFSILKLILIMGLWSKRYIPLILALGHTARLYQDT